MEKEIIKIAVVIPCWNEENLLPEMLNSILLQTYTNWIAICVDDHSTDRTAEIIKSYHNQDERIIYVLRDKEPKGGQTCRNIGLAHITDAKYVCFFDADDTIAPYCLEQRVSFMEEHPLLDCGVFPAIAYVNNINEEQGDVYGVKIFDDDLKAILNMNLPMTGWTNIYRVSCRDLFDLKWDEQVLSMQDSDYSLKMLLSGVNYDYATNALVDYYYHIGDGGVAKKISTVQHFDSHIYCLDKITRSISNMYGKEYDFYLEVRIYLHVRMFYNTWKPYHKLLNLSWLKGRWAFKMRLLIYLLTFKRGRRFLFNKYHKYTNQQTDIWRQSMKKYRKILQLNAYKYNHESCTKKNT